MAVSLPSWRSVVTLVPVLAVLLTLGACDGDDSDDAADGQTTTSAETRPEVPDTPDEPLPEDAAEAPPDVGDEDEGLGDPLVFIADLTGDTEVPGPGDDAGTGRIEIESAAPGEWCIDMEATGLSSEVTDSHIHFGTEGRSGDVVIPIGAPTETDDDTDTWTDVCVSVEEDLANEVIDAPQAFYANIHTVDHPNGAIRGQLEPSSIFDLTLS